MRHPFDQFGQRHRLGRGEQDGFDHAFLLAHRRGFEQAFFDRIAHGASVRRIINGRKDLALFDLHLTTLGHFQNRREMRSSGRSCGGRARPPTPRA